MMRYIIIIIIKQSPRKKKLRLFFYFIKPHKNIYETYESFAQRLHQKYKLMIEPQAIRSILDYILQMERQKITQKAYESFAKEFKNYRYNNLYQIIDVFIFNHFIDYQHKMPLFAQFCLNIGYQISYNDLFQQVQNSYNKIGSFNINLGEIDNMSGTHFEYFIGNHFQYKGYQVRHTKKSKDKGADLIISNEKGKTLVQCKRWNKKVGIKAVQEAHTARDYYNIKNAMVITNSFFSDDAIKVANKINVELWDRSRLINELSNNYNKNYY